MVSVPFHKTLRHPLKAVPGVPTFLRGRINGFQVGKMTFAFKIKRFLSWSVTFHLSLKVKQELFFFFWQKWRKLLPFSFFSPHLLLSWNYDYKPHFFFIVWHVSFFTSTAMQRQSLLYFLITYKDISESLDKKSPQKKIIFSTLQAASSEIWSWKQKQEEEALPLPLLLAELFRSNTKNEEFIVILVI